MPIVVPEIEYLRTIDPRLGDALQKIVDEVNLTQKASGVAPAGRLPAPSTVAFASVNAANGAFDVALQDTGVSQPGTYYFLEHATKADFSDGHVEGPSSSRNFHLWLGSGTFFFRAYSAYLGSAVTSTIVVFGGTTPTGVAGGGALAGPARSAPQGSGTSQVPGFGFGTPPNQIAGRRVALE